jgi:3-oxoacyl-(acyl-carrier-protein) synthase
MGRVFVTGMGIISPIGNSVAGNRNALQQARSGLSSIELFKTRYANLLPFGEIKVADEELKQKLNANSRGITRTTLLALHAFDEAVNDAGLSAAQLQSFDTALVGANTIGGMCRTEELHQDASSSDVGTEFLSNYDLGSVHLYLQQRYGINGVASTVNTACSSSANSIMYGARLLKHGFAKRAIVGGVDSLAKFTINGFNSLNILSQYPTRAFDKDRSGLNLGEGAAFLVLEREEDVKGKKVYAEVSGYSNTSDAFHPSSLSDNGEGPYLAMKQALEIAKLHPHQIGFINAHGTGTENNDEVESRAMIRVFETPPPFASTKPNVGHTLGAAGAIEAVYCVLNIFYQEVYKALHFAEPIPATGLVPVGEYRQMELQHVMSNSFGFGGACSSLIFSRV